jgi:hypothetical protein
MTGLSPRLPVEKLGLIMVTTQDDGTKDENRSGRSPAESFTRLGAIIGYLVPLAITIERPISRRISWFGAVHHERA